MIGGDWQSYCTYYHLLFHPDLPKVLSFVYSDGDAVCPARLVFSLLICVFFFTIYWNFLLTKRVLSLKRNIEFSITCILNFILQLGICENCRYWEIFNFLNACSIKYFRSIEKFHRHLQKLNDKRIEVLRFSDSLHVEHYR